MKTLTIFTPTYNRADLLSRGYAALCRQTSTDCCWLVIDDGSTDSTTELVRSWLIVDSICAVEGGFEGYAVDAPWLHIRYCYKENGGLHTGYNKAIELMDTELCVCIDSDDYMPDDAVEIILDRWKKYNNGNIAGVIGLDCRINGELLGENFVEGTVTHVISLREDPRYNFDNKIVVRVDLLKKVAPQPTIHGEKNFNPIWMIFKVDELAPFVLINKILCMVDYQDGGMSYDTINQYFNSPHSFLELRKFYLTLKYASLKYRLKNHIHLIAQSHIARENVFTVSPNPLISFLLYPLGLLLFFYMRRKHKQHNRRNR